MPPKKLVTAVLWLGMFIIGCLIAYFWLIPYLDAREAITAEPSPIIYAEIPCATQPAPKHKTLVERIIDPSELNDKRLTQFFDAILQLEGGIPNIQESFWDDAMAFADQDWDYHKYRDTFRWKWAAIFYFRRYNPIAWSKKDWLSLARTYRGGPDGHKQLWTLDYGLELMRIMDYLKQDESRGVINYEVEGG